MTATATGNDKRLTITFDNGPDPDCTGGVLDVLGDRGIRSTFFVCGLGNQLHPALSASATAGRALLDRMINEGHWVGNHTLTHTVELGTTIDPDVIAREVGDNERLLDGYNTHRLFRPYMSGGLRGPRTFSLPAVDYLCNNGYTVVLFNSCPGDWVDPTGWQTTALADIAEHDWTLIVVHDVARYGGMASLAGFLDRVVAEGIEIRQDFPDSCVPIRDGLITSSLDGLICGAVPEPARQISTDARSHINQITSAVPD